MGAGAVSRLCEPLCAPGDSLTKSLENRRETRWIGVPLGGSPSKGMSTVWLRGEAIISEELGVSFVGGNIPVTCFAKVAIAR